MLLAPASLAMMRMAPNCTLYPRGYALPARHDACVALLLTSLFLRSFLAFLSGSLCSDLDQRSSSSGVIIVVMSLRFRLFIRLRALLCETAAANPDRESHVRTV